MNVKEMLQNDYDAPDIKSILLAKLTRYECGGLVSPRGDCTCHEVTLLNWCKGWDEPWQCSPGWKCFDIGECHGEGNVICQNIVCLQRGRD